MSKYIIEIPDDVQYVLLNGKADNKYYTAVRPIAELEELNSDYINEHFGELQDEAYQKGFEDGKEFKEKGCEGCKYESVKEGEPPCRACSKAYKNRYTPAPHSDSIEVGDEVIAPCGKAVVTAVKDDLVHYFYSEGDFGCVEPYHVTKTGKHYDIASILEAMRNDR